ncbi:hypothetical protein MFMK1_002984 [Metallumcola ferriviriculae]|uniref:4Fe-4S ferredoxin-type domain-containing protein n=1 Tax=Metallumcola ferriviriculae TaxID=3039180 RepID=A0AAU0USB4_9FIRM|nr:hypothetical protein MFMK1_002984 [Desulfitibacteraceae bacterium MK1]
MREKIKKYAVELGVEDVGIAAVEDYQSPQSPALESIYPGAKSMVVLAYRELSTCESPNPQIAMNGRLDVMEFSRSCNYKVAQFLERECGAKAMTVPASWPMDINNKTKGVIGEVSLRHAAIAAGLGAFGRHNLVVHPQLGSRMIFTAILSDLEITSDAPPKENPCDQCNQCVEACPAQALNEEGKTDFFKCLKNSQPYGLGGNIRFWSKFADASPEDRKEMLRDDYFWRLYQAGFIGFQYFCFKCLAACPVGQR